MTSVDPPESDFTINPAQIVARGVAEGMSANAIGRSLQEAGAGFRRQTVLRMVSEVRAAIANRPMVAAMPTDRLPTGDEYARWTTARRGFSTQMLIVTRDRETGLIGTAKSSYTTGSAHTIDEAIQNKLQDWQDLTETGDQYEDQQLLGIVPWNIFEMGPE